MPSIDHFPSTHATWIGDRARAAGREVRDPAGDDGLLDTLPSSEPNAERAFDRAWAVTLANEAHVIAQTDADDRGRPDDYVVFRMHVMDRMEYDAIAAALGITPSQAKHAAARVGERMRGRARAAAGRGRARGRARC